MSNNYSEKELYSTKVYKDALAFALKAHKNQKTPENLPYSFHICSVANEIIHSLSIYKISYDKANIAIACALLHDVNEDTSTIVSKDTLKLDNIDSVIAGVAALTKDETLGTKQEQMKDSLNRLAQQPYCVQMVKLADRITNLAPAPLFWNKAKRQSYVNEAKLILDTLKDSNDYLASKLQYKIDNYAIDLDDDYIVFKTKNSQLILDKSHKNYLKTFKAINRLNEYLNHSLFNAWINITKDRLQEYKNNLDLNYIKSNISKNDQKVQNFLNKIDTTVIYG